MDEHEYVLCFVLIFLKSPPVLCEFNYQPSVPSCY